MIFLQIRFGHLKLTSATPGLSNHCKLRFKSNIAGIFKIDIYRIVGVTWIFESAHLLQVYTWYSHFRDIIKNHNILMSN